MKNVNLMSKAVLGSLIALTLSACGENTPIGRMTQKLKHPELMNSWEEESCVSSAFGFWGSSRKTQYSFKAQELEKKDLYYTDKNCQDLAVTAKFTGDYQTGNQVREGVQQIDIKFEKASVTVHNQSGLDRLNAVKACGTNWMINESRDVTDHSADLTCLNEKVPYQAFDIFSIQDNVLRLGGVDSQNSPEKRPADLDNEHRFLKK